MLTKTSAAQAFPFSVSNDIITPSLSLFIPPPSPFDDLFYLQPPVFDFLKLQSSLLTSSSFSGTLHHFSESSRFPFTFDILIPSPFYLFDFNSSLDKELLIFNLDDPQLLTYLYSQDTCSVLQDLLQIQMYQTNVFIAFDSSTYHRSPQSRRPKPHLRNHLSSPNSFFPHVRHRCQPSFALCRHHQQQTQCFFNSDGEAWSL